MAVHPGRRCSLATGPDIGWAGGADAGADGGLRVCDREDVRAMFYFGCAATGSIAEDGTGVSRRGVLDLLIGWLDICVFF